MEGGARLKMKHIEKLFIDVFCFVKSLVRYIALCKVKLHKETILMKTDEPNVRDIYKGHKADDLTYCYQ